jgi:hypothetical protein
MKIWPNSGQVLSHSLVLKMCNIRKIRSTSNNSMLFLKEFKLTVLGCTNGVRSDPMTSWGLNGPLLVL